MSVLALKTHTLPSGSIAFSHYLRLPLNSVLNCFPSHLCKLIYYNIDTNFMLSHQFNKMIIKREKCNITQLLKKESLLMPP